MSRVEVLPSGDGWKVELDGTEQGPTYANQAEAEKEGRRLAMEAGAEFQLHSSAGEIREKDSYGNDPSDVKG